MEQLVAACDERMNLHSHLIKAAQALYLVPCVSTIPSPACAVVVTAYQTALIKPRFSSFLLLARSMIVSPDRPRDPIHTADFVLGTRKAVTSHSWLRRPRDLSRGRSRACLQRRAPLLMLPVRLLQRAMPPGKNMRYGVSIGGMGGIRSMKGGMGRYGVSMGGIW